MRLYAVLLTMLATVFGCSKDTPFSLQVMPAVLVENPDQPPASGWTRVEYAGSPQTGPGLFDVAPDTLLTEWNIIAFKAASPSDSTRSVIIRLNAYAQQKMKAFSTNQANIKKPLAIRIDGRWADFMPVLDRITDRVTLNGFTPRDLVRLKTYMATK